MRMWGSLFSKQCLLSLATGAAKHFVRFPLVFHPGNKLDLDFSGYHKSRIQLLFYYTLFHVNYAKTIV